jgi:YHS domain-containing protein
VIRYLLLAILILIVARLFWRLMDGVLEAAGGTTRSRRKAAATKLVRDPVCGTFVAPTTALTADAGGMTHYFCSEKCQSEFKRSR